MEASQLPGAVKGKGGESALVVVLLSVFVLGGAGGQSASGAVKGKGGESALELSCSAGDGGESASGG